MGVRVLAAAALIVSGVLLAFVPTRTAAAAKVSLQCQVSANPSAQLIDCSGTLLNGAVTLNCQSPGPITSNGGVFTLAPAACSGIVSLTGANIPGNLNFNALTIDTNTGTINASNGSGTLTVNGGISSATATCTGSFFSQTFSPLALTVPDGSCNVNVSVLGIGTSKITSQSGSVSVLPGAVLSIDSPKVSVDTSVLGLVTNIACGSSVIVNLLTPSITVPLAPCSAP
jgi:hypothetical protein